MQQKFQKLRLRRRGSHRTARRPLLRHLNFILINIIILFLLYYKIILFLGHLTVMTNQSLIAVLMLLNHSQLAPTKLNIFCRLLEMKIN
jgi:hypothetical protein